jgi:ankyrin repeat protein
MTPVHVAAAWGQKSLLQLLLNSGGDPELFDDEGLTPLDYAQRENHAHIVEMLSRFEVTHDSPKDDHNVTLQLGKLLNDTQI